MTVSRRHRRDYCDPGHAHELTFSCYHGYQFCKTERVCRWLADAIQEARTTWNFDLWAWVFMPEHVHLLIHPRDAVYEIAPIRAAIKQPVARHAVSFLRRERPDWLDKIAVRKAGRVRYQFWQKGGGYDRNVIEPKTLLAMIDYIHLNPVRRGLVEHADKFYWSSAAWYLRQIAIPIPVDPIPPEWTV